MSTIEWIILLASLVYLLRVVLFSIGTAIERRKRHPDAPPGYRPFVSVVVPARNEELHVEACVRSILESRYPNDSFELIVVNDQSEDDTAAILARLSVEFPQLKVITTTDDADNPNLQGKTRALHQGIVQTRGEILMMTDADCTVPDTWIPEVVLAFADCNLGMLASFTVVDADTAFEKLQALEWVFNHTLASGGVGLKQPLGCFGNNISLRRRAYDEVGGYATIAFSVTEDLALLQAVSRTRWGIRYVCDNRLKVTTHPAQDAMTFIRQHQRWAKGGKELGWRATIFVLSTASIWLALLLSILFAGPFWLAGVFASRAVGDYMVIEPSLRELRLKTLGPWFPLAVLFFLCIELILPLFLLPRKVKWKGREFQQSVGRR